MVWLHLFKGGKKIEIFFHLKLNCTSLSNMQTRSQTKALLNQLEFVFDFDASIAAWKANKKRGPNCTYTYVCQKKTISGEFCKRKCLAGQHFCKAHCIKL